MQAPLPSLVPCVSCLLWRWLGRGGTCALGIRPRAAPQTNVYPKPGGLLGSSRVTLVYITCLVVFIPVSAVVTLGFGRVVRH